MAVWNLDNDPYPWQNPWHWADVDGDGQIAPVDVLILINDINANGTRPLPTPPPPGAPPRFLDPSGDGGIAPDDVLQVINDINANGTRLVPNDLPEGGGGGESASGTEAPLIGAMAGAEGEAALVTDWQPWFAGPSVADETASDSHLRFDRAQLAEEAERLPMHNRLKTVKPRPDATTAFLGRRNERAAQADDFFAGNVEFLELDDALGDIAPLISAAWRART